MGYFRVMIHGTGIRIPSEGNGAPIAGFYATRIVRAPSEQEARAKAIALVQDLWGNGAEAKANRGQAPALVAESSASTTMLQWLLFHNKGHSFYPEEVHVA